MSLKRNLKFKHVSRRSRTCTSPGRKCLKGGEFTNRVYVLSHEWEAKCLMEMTLMMGYRHVTQECLVAAFKKLNIFYRKKINS